MNNHAGALEFLFGVRPLDGAFLSSELGRLEKAASSRRTPKYPFTFLLREYNPGIIDRIFPVALSVDRPKEVRNEVSVHKFDCHWRGVLSGCGFL